MGRPAGKRPLGKAKRRMGMILKRIFWKWDGEAWNGLIWLSIGTGECGNEPLGYIKCW
jgi:hypothetical protein